MRGLPALCRLSFARLGIMTVPAILIVQRLLYIEEEVHLYGELRSTHSYETGHSKNLGFLGVVKAKLKIGYIS